MDFDNEYCCGCNTAEKELVKENNPLGACVMLLWI